MNDEFEARADRASALLLARFNTPRGYDEAHNLLAVAYLQGARDELKRIIPCSILPRDCQQGKNGDKQDIRTIFGE